MKSKYFLLSIAFIFVYLLSFSANASAADSKDSIKVWGNCDMCKNRIEKAAKEAGAATAEWSDESKILVVNYDDSKTSSRKIQDKIAAIGHDTQDVEAPQASYSKLPGCCKYERKSAKP